MFIWTFRRLLVYLAVVIVRPRDRPFWPFCGHLTIGGLIFIALAVWWIFCHFVVFVIVIVRFLFVTSVTFCLALVSCVTLVGDVNWIWVFGRIWFWIDAGFGWRTSIRTLFWRRLCTGRWDTVYLNVPKNICYSLVLQRTF